MVIYSHIIEKKNCTIRRKLMQAQLLIDGKHSMDHFDTKKIT